MCFKLLGTVGISGGDFKFCLHVYVEIVFLQTEKNAFVVKYNSRAAGSRSERCHGATAGVAVLPLCSLSMAPAPLAGSTVVFHYPRLSQSPMSPGLEQFCMAWCGMAWRQAVHRADASFTLDRLSVN